MISRTISQEPEWRTADGNEIDFVLPNVEKPFATEIKFDEAMIKPLKYKKFDATYPGIPLSFNWYNPFDEDFFRRLPQKITSTSIPHQLLYCIP